MPRAAEGQIEEQRIMALPQLSLNSTGVKLSGAVTHSAKHLPILKVNEQPPRIAHKQLLLLLHQEDTSLFIESLTSLKDF